MSRRRQIRINFISSTFLTTNFLQKSLNIRSYKSIKNRLWRWEDRSRRKERKMKQRWGTCVKIILNSIYLNWRRSIKVSIPKWKRISESKMNWAIEKANLNKGKCRPLQGWPKKILIRRAYRIKMTGWLIRILKSQITTVNFKLWRQNSGRLIRNGLRPKTITISRRQTNYLC